VRVVSVPISVAILALVDGLLAFLALYIAVCNRFQTPLDHIQLLEAEIGPIWPRALVFSLIVVISLMAFGLYSTHLQGPDQGRDPEHGPRLSDVLARVAVAVLVASCAVSALFYLVPTLRLWRGVEAIAVIAAGAGVVLARVVLAAWVKRNNRR
jgi:hypothetical protein